MSASLHAKTRTIPKKIRPSEEACWEVIRRAKLARITWIHRENDQLMPRLRTIHPAVLGGVIYWHSGLVGEKHSMLDARASLSFEEFVATIPSTFVDPTLACPATTYYRSVHLDGHVLPVMDLAEKARVFNVMLDMHQKDAGHRPLSAEDPLYRQPLERIAVLRFLPAAMTGRFKLGQRKSAERMRAVMRGLWRRGEPGDLRAMESIGAAHEENVWPEELGLFDDLTLQVSGGARESNQIGSLLKDEYWNAPFSTRAIARAHQNSSAWIFAKAGDEIVGSVRAIADATKHAKIYDVWVRPEYRGRGIASRLLRILLTHPNVRGCSLITLSTRDAHRLYERLGFERDNRDRSGRAMIRRVSGS